MNKFILSATLFTTTLGFKINVTNLSPIVKYDDYVLKAAERWEKIIIGTKINPGRELILNIDFTIGKIDKVGGTLGYAGYRSISNEFGDLPTSGMMKFDEYDIENLKNQGTLEDLILHEMGHVLGIGSLWKFKGLIPANCHELEENVVYNDGHILIENDGGPGTKCSHWDESIYKDELMTGYLGKVNYLTNITVSSLDDLGYIVDYNSDTIDKNGNGSSLTQTDIIGIIIGITLFIVIVMIISTYYIYNKIQKIPNEKNIEYV